MKKFSMKLYDDIERTKNKLRKQPICENFGDKEVRSLQDKYHYNDLIYGSTLERMDADLIDNFIYWCQEYTGKE